MSDRAVAWVLVASQFVLIAAVVLAPGEHWVVSTWMQVCAAGAIAVAALLGVWAARWLGKGLTPLPLPNGRTDLVVHGPYRWVRHPIYTAVLIGTAGVALRSGTWWSVAAAGGLAALFMVKARWEELHLDAAFPGYAAYHSRTGRFVPGVG